MSSTMPNPYAHHADCEFWHDHYEHECTCSRPGMNPPAADPTRDLCAVRAEIAELRRRIERLEARIGGMAQADPCSIWDNVMLIYRLPAI